MKEFNSLKELIDGFKLISQVSTFTVKQIPAYDMLYFYNINSTAYVIEKFGYVKI